jgi:uncharacterized protein
MLSFFRYILLILLIFLIWKLIKILHRRSKESKKQKDNHPKDNRPLKPVPETLLRCAQCGIHVPKKEAIYSEDGRVFCCHSHKESVK